MPRFPRPFLPRLLPKGLGRLYDLCGRRILLLFERWLVDIFIFIRSGSTILDVVERCTRQILAGSEGADLI